MRWEFPFERTSEPEGGVTITFPDVPEAITYSEGDAMAAMRDAEDALITALESFYIGQGQPVPEPSAAHSRTTLRLTPVTVAKLILWNALVQHSTSQCAAEGDRIWGRRRPNVTRLAHTFGFDEKELRRLLDLRHRSHMDRIVRLLTQLEVRVALVSGPLPADAPERAWA